MRRTWLPRIRIRRARDGRAAPALSRVAAGSGLAPISSPRLAVLLSGLACAVFLVVAFAGPSAADLVADRPGGTGGISLADGSSGVRARPDCTCRYFGVKYRIGETVCLRGPDGPRLARCSMMLNNTTWETLDRSCPTSARAPVTLAAAFLCRPGG